MFSGLIEGQLLSDMLQLVSSNSLTGMFVVENDDAFFRSADPDYLQFLRDFVGRHSERFERLFANDDFTVYRIIRPR